MTGRDGSSVLLLFPASVCVPLAAPSRTTAEQIALAPTPVHLWMFASRRTHPKQEERVPRIRRGRIDANGADVLRQHGEPAKQCVVSHHFLLFSFYQTPSVLADPGMSPILIFRSLFRGLRPADQVAAKARAQSADSSTA
jgi:hypothetical protein